MNHYETSFFCDKDAPPTARLVKTVTGYAVTIGSVDKAYGITLHTGMVGVKALIASLVAAVEAEEASI